MLRWRASHCVIFKERCPMVSLSRGSCRFQKLDSCVPVMQFAQDCMCDDVPEALDRAHVRCILPERNMRTRRIIIVGDMNSFFPSFFLTSLGPKNQVMSTTEGPIRS